MAEQAAFVIAYLFSIGLAHYKGSRAMLRTAYVLAANSVVCNLAMIAVGQSDPGVWFMLMDVISALAMFVRPCGRVEMAIVWVYAAQLAVHFGHRYGASEGVNWFYLAMLNVGGGFQIAILIFGASYGHGRKVPRWRGFGGNHRMAVAPVIARLAGGQRK